MKLQNTNQLTKEQWLELRKKGIGGSDIGAIFGLNPYKSPIQLWLEKTGKIESPDISDKLQVKLGNMLEDAVAQLFEDETGLKVKKNNFVLQHNEHPFMLANIDREGRDKEGKRFILECKTTSSYGAKQWQDEEIPPAYELQVLHYLIVTGYDYGYIACLIGNHAFKVKRIDLDDQTKQIIIDRCRDFWQLVVNNEMPPVDSSESCGNILSDLYPEAKQESSIDLSYDDQIDELLQKRETLKSQVKELETDIDYIENYLKNELKDNESGMTKQYRVNWKNVTTNRFDSTSFKKSYPDLADQFNKQTQSRRFEVKKIKGDN